MRRRDSGVVVTTCSFCGKSEDRRGGRLVIAGPNGVAICAECVDLCSEIVEENNRQRTEPPGGWTQYEACCTRCGHRWPVALDVREAEAVATCLVCGTDTFDLTERSIEP